jgi:hypothetical protein
MIAFDLNLPIEMHPSDRSSALGMALLNMQHANVCYAKEGPSNGSSNTTPVEISFKLRVLGSLSSSARTNGGV